MHLKQIMKKFRPNLIKESFDPADIAEALAPDFGYNPANTPKWVEALVNQKEVAVVFHAMDEYKHIRSPKKTYEQNAYKMEKKLNQIVNKFIDLAQSELDVELQFNFHLLPVTHWVNFDVKGGKSHFLSHFVSNFVDLNEYYDETLGAFILPISIEWLFPLQDEYEFGQELVHDDWLDWTYEFGLSISDLSVEIEYILDEILDVYKAVERDVQYLQRYAPRKHGIKK